MAREVAEIEREIRSLGVLDKETLLRALVEELDGPADPDVESAWAQETAKRCQELDDGSVTSIPGDQVFAEIEAELGK